MVSPRVEFLVMAPRDGSSEFFGGDKPEGPLTNLLRSRCSKSVFPPQTFKYSWRFCNVMFFGS